MSKVCLKIYSQNFNGSMSAKFFTKQNNILNLLEFKQGINTVELDIVLPNLLYIFLDGKDNACDTVVNDKGEIIQDKFLRIEDILLDLKPIDKNILSKMCKCQTAKGKVIHSTHLGFNGIVTLDFNYPTSLVTHLFLKKNYA